MYIVICYILWIIYSIVVVVVVLLFAFTTHTRIHAKFITCLLRHPTHHLRRTWTTNRRRSYRAFVCFGCKKDHYYVPIYLCSFPPSIHPLMPHATWIAKAILLLSFCAQDILCGRLCCMLVEMVVVVVEMVVNGESNDRSRLRVWLINVCNRWIEYNHKNICILYIIVIHQHSTTQPFGSDHLLPRNTLSKYPLIVSSSSCLNRLI